VWNVKTKTIAIGSNSGKWNHLKFIHTNPEKQIGKAWNLGTTENSHIGHCTLTAERTNGLYWTFNMRNNIIRIMNCNNSYVLETNTIYFRYIIVNNLHQGDNKYYYYYYYYYYYVNNVLLNNRWWMLYISSIYSSTFHIITLRVTLNPHTECEARCMFYFHKRLDPNTHLFQLSNRMLKERFTLLPCSYNIL
jgi:hypothetical protein